jgi:release factor glutamine methyltransferase
MAIESEVPPTVGAQLAHAERALATAGSRASRDEALALLGSLLRAPVALLLAQTERRLSQAEVETYARWIARRASGEALPHITGHLRFMGLDLAVGRDTPLVPLGAQRLVEVALESARHHLPGELAAAEIGTGCGAIALALAAFEPRFTRFYAVDAAASALRIAQDNGARYLLNLVITWLEGEGPDAVPEPVDLFVCGQCGDATSLQFARLLEQAPTKLRPGGAFVCGLDSAQEAMAAESVECAFRGAQIWVEPPSDGVVVVVAQVPRRAGGDAAFERRR